MHRPDPSPLVDFPPSGSLIRGLAWAALAGSVACAHAKIPETQLDDTPENREVLDVMSAYQRAFEGRNADKILELISPTFYEDNGNTDVADDYDRGGLADSLRKEFERTKKVQLELRIDDIQVDDGQASAFVFYTLRAQNDFPAGEKWQTTTDRARVQLEKQDGRWLIRSGI
jgi:ketosteroid isomerase-like protein